MIERIVEGAHTGKFTPNDLYMNDDVLDAAVSEADRHGAYVTVHQLQTNPVEFPVEVRISGTSDVDPAQEPADIENLRRMASQVRDILQPIPGVQVVQNDWFSLVIRS